MLNDPFFREPFRFDPFNAPAALTGPETSGDAKSSSESKAVAAAPAERSLSSRFFPVRMPMDVVESKNDYRISMDLPGVKPDEVKVECKDGVLTISGSRKHERKDENGRKMAVVWGFGGMCDRVLLCASPTLINLHLCALFHS